MADRKRKSTTATAERDDIGAYLEHFLENVGSLPAELNRNFSLLKELDQKSLETKRQMVTLHRKFIRNHTRGQDNLTPLIEQLDEKQKACLGFADEKVSLAVQTYDLLDQHIRQLDADLKRFEEDLKQDPSYRRRRNSGASGAGSARAPPSSSSSKKNRVKDELNTDIDLAVDPNEPVYCTCKQVSFGQMVACDNPDCLVEWFHFECVGLTQLPKGTKWYCPECRKHQKK